ncbi:MAG: hypothetical protein HKO59_10085 [Phycisphaerales bacterium]|nr:hypothetical protein [Phycisphaerae bacterium]NNF41587.1 hypothetical protein [Phycisphaerales bacterium]NNM26313.1 hypothetical protein [Phycisphaerales bacterium]
MRRIPAGHRHAFTLVEMLVAVGVVVFLVGLTLSAGAALAARSDVEQTKSTLQLLDLAVREWELAADRPVSWGDIPGVSDIWAGRAEVLITTELLTRIARQPTARTILTQIDPAFVYTYQEGVHPAWIYWPQEQAEQAQFTGGLAILDAWGTPIYTTHPGAVVRSPSGGVVIDPDGTEQTFNERKYGVARDRRICFVSAGPDRRWGSMSAVPGTIPFEETQDNIFSYAVDRP